ncbi:MAG: PhzF family phenazine biosynthesis protein [Candidatus Eremiobacteraeota bacterium]|nr:PhzF family phenazine biosynthesis protein [Candidatus Eremiobacteraeota bacterium]
MDARYMLFDVFTDVAFAGNQLAVFPETTFQDATMQRIARELNLAETVFVNRVDGVAASLRIFTPRAEVPFAGHPTVGTAIALVDHLSWVPPNQSSFVLRERVGDVPIAIERTKPTTAWLTTPPVSLERKIPLVDGAAALGLDDGAVREDLPCQFASAGNLFLYVPLVSKEAVDRAVLDEAALRRLVPWNFATGVYLFAQTEEGAYARMFAPAFGVPEDPATGSATGPLYAYLAAHGALPKKERFVNEQGVAIGRRSVLFVRLTWNGESLSAIEVGGNALLVGEGVLNVADR